MKKRIGLAFVFVIFFLFSAGESEAAFRIEKERLSAELRQAGYEIVREKDFFGIPAVEIVFPLGQSVQTVCRKVPALNEIFFEAREALAILNGLDPFFPRSDEGNPYDAARKTLLIPLDTSIQPKAFPAHNERLAEYQKAVLVDLENQLLAYYESGELKACLPISSGKPGKKTPRMSGWITFKKKDKVSGTYDVPMPYSLHLLGPYYIHYGVMPGAPDSAGCIRLFEKHAEWLFERVDRAWFEAY